MATNDSTMRGLWLEAGELTLRRDLPVPQPAPDETLVRVTRAGICATDLHLQRGYYPFTGILGHEFTGTAVGGPSDLVGARVVGEINAACGRCDACSGGRERHCPRRTVLGIRGRHGAFADFLTLPTRNLHRLPESIDDDQAVFVEPLAAALHIRDQVDLGPDDDVLVVGDGKLGQLIVRALAPTGCELTLLGRHEAKLDLVRRLGIDAVTQLDPSHRYAVAIDCTGAPAGFAVAREALRPAGTLVMKSTYGDQLTVDASSLVVDEIRLVGSRCGPFEPAIQALARGDIVVGPIIQARYGLDHGVEAFAHAARRGALKILLDHKLS